MTSHDAVSFVRKVYQTKQVGHAGTLDPAAAGVLPVLLGRATRLVEYFADCSKSYRVELTFGYQTDTGDDTGSVIDSQDPSNLRLDQIETVLRQFLGAQSQIPPAYSAIKIGGKKMYELARQGLEVQPEPRQITIHDIKLLRVRDNTILFDVACSKGTYIRSLCVDIGQAAGCPAVMSFLVRTRVGRFLLDTAATLEEIRAQPETCLTAPDLYLDHLPPLTIDCRLAAGFINGQKIPAQTVMPDAGNASGDDAFLRIYHDNRFIGIGKATAHGLIAPHKIFPSDN